MTVERVPSVLWYLSLIWVLQNCSHSRQILLMFDGELYTMTLDRVPSVFWSVSLLAVSAALEGASRPDWMVLGARTSSAGRCSETVGGGTHSLTHLARRLPVPAVLCLLPARP